MIFKNTFEVVGLTILGLVLSFGLAVLITGIGVLGAGFILSPIIEKDMPKMEKENADFFPELTKGLGTK